MNGLDEAVARAREAAGDNDVSLMGGADVIRQTLRAGLAEELTVSIAPVVLGGGKRLFDGFTESLTLEPDPRPPVTSRDAPHLPGDSLTGVNRPDGRHVAERRQRSP